MVLAWAAAAVSVMPVVIAAPPMALVGLPRKTFAVKTPSYFSLGRTTPSSFVNQYLQCWDVPNVFSFGAAAAPAEHYVQLHIDDRRRYVLATRCDQKINTTNHPDRSCPDERQVA
jgi:hypothetical protein